MTDTALERYLTLMQSAMPKTRVAALSFALKFYADLSNWEVIHSCDDRSSCNCGRSVATLDGGDLARTTLYWVAKSKRERKKPYVEKKEGDSVND